MAGVLNLYFSSVFTTEDISSLPVPFTKFEDNKSEHLGQFCVTPEIIAKTIKKMKDNKSPGVDGIPPKHCLRKLLSKLVVTRRNSSFRMERENITPLFKKGSRKKSQNYKPVSCISITRNIN